MPEKTTEIEPARDFEPIFGDANTALDVVRENFGPQGFSVNDLERITVPAGGGTSWEVPSITGSESLKELTGIILAWRSPRAYWAESLEESGGGSPPDCFSDEGQYGSGLYGVGSELHPNGECETCPMNEWGSGDPESRSKACKEMRLLFLLRPGQMIPMAVVLPPTSIQPLRKFFLRLAASGVPYYGVTVALGLERVKASGSIVYSTVVPKAVGQLTGEQRDSVKAFAAIITGRTSGAAQAAAGTFQEAATSE